MSRNAPTAAGMSSVSRSTRYLPVVAVVPGAW
jgi:hypothetical protein